MTPVPARRSLDEWLHWQEGLNPRSIELGLERVSAVARRLELQANPPPTLTVAGTNGKGSTATLAALMLREAGNRVGLYTSPHLLRYNERVQLNGVAVDDAALCRAFEAIERARMGVQLTYFEFGTLAALWLFREAAVDVQVLEVGLGGRLDAVNLVDATVAVLTNIGLDHQDWLGPDRASIGREKAGIFRAGRPAVLGERDPPASVIATAGAVGASVLRLGADYDYHRRGTRWSWRGLQTALEDLPLPALAGDRQLDNAAAAIAAVLALPPQLSVDVLAIRRALPALQLPARLESRWTAAGEVLLDVAHNEEAMTALVDHLSNLNGRRKVVVLGMLADKPAHAVASRLAAQASHALLVGLPGARGLSAHELADRVAGSGLQTQCCDNMRAALTQARALAGPDGLVVVTGSFLTVAEALTLLA